jgi:hypothetical protein
MICQGCHRNSNHIKSYFVDGILLELCSSCGHFSEAGGTKTDGLLTRNSFRVRKQSLEYEGDMLLPHKYDKISRKVVPNDDFLKKYPDKAGEYFKQRELDKAGYSKLKAKNWRKGYDDAEHSGNASQRIKEVLK